MSGQDERHVAPRAAVTAGDVGSGQATTSRAHRIGSLLQ